MTAFASHSKDLNIKAEKVNSGWSKGKEESEEREALHLQRLCPISGVNVDNALHGEWVDIIRPVDSLRSSCRREASIRRPGASAFLRNFGKKPEIIFFRASNTALTPSQFFEAKKWTLEQLDDMEKNSNPA